MHVYDELAVVHVALQQTELFRVGIELCWTKLIQTPWSAKPSSPQRGVNFIISEIHVGQLVKDLQKDHDWKSINIGSSAPDGSSD